MKHIYHTAGRAYLALAVLVAGIAPLSGCDSYQISTQFQTDSNLEADSSGTDADSGSSSANKVESLIAIVGSNGFALWSKGKFVVSDDDGSDLLFEIDPVALRTRIWTTLQIDDAVQVAGNVRAESFSTSGYLQADSISASDAQVADLVANTLDASYATVDSAYAEELEASSASADVLHAVVAEIETLVVSSIEAEELTVDALEVGSLEAGSLEARSLEAGSASFDDAAVATLEVDELDGGSLLADAIEATYASIEEAWAGVANIDELGADEVSAGNVTASGSMTAGSMTAESMTADCGEFSELVAQVAKAGSIAADEATIGSAIVDSLEAVYAEFESMMADEATIAELDAESVCSGSVVAESISGMLESFSVKSDYAGTAVFPEVGSDGEGLYDSVTVQTDEDADGLIVTPVASGESMQITYEVENLGSGCWSITRVFPESVDTALEEGSFAGIDQTSVYWLAVDFE